MAVDYKRMQQRFGTYSEYQTNENGILPNLPGCLRPGHGYLWGRNRKIPKKMWWGAVVNKKPHVPS